MGNSQKKNKPPPPYKEKVSISQLKKEKRILEDAEKMEQDKIVSEKYKKFRSIILDMIGEKIKSTPSNENTFIIHIFDYSYVSDVRSMKKAMKKNKKPFLFHNINVTMLDLFYHLECKYGEFNLYCEKWNSEFGTKIHIKDFEFPYVHFKILDQSFEVEV